MRITKYILIFLVIIVCSIILMVIFNKGGEDEIVSDSVVGIAFKDNTILTDDERIIEEERLLFLRENASEFEEISNNLLSGDISYEIEISSSEFNLRKKIYEKEGLDYTKDDLLEILVNEKIVFNEGRKRNIFDQEEISKLFNQIWDQIVLFDKENDVVYEYEKFNLILWYGTNKLQASLDMDLQDFLEDREKEFKITFEDVLLIEK
jgi:hypothetical protein